MNLERTAKLSERIRFIQNRVGTVKLQRVEWEKDAKAAKDQAERLEEARDDTTEAVSLLTAAADAQRKEVKQRVEGIVDTAIRGVFGKRMRFRLNEEFKRNQMNIEPQVGYRRRGKTEWVSMGNVGGGVADVVSFCLRVTTLALMKGVVPQVVIADEPFKWVSSGYLPKVAEMLEELTKVTGIQMVIVSHEEEISDAADKVIRIRMDNGTSTVEDRH